jgi:hypothetical protein
MYATLLILSLAAVSPAQARLQAADAALSAAEAQMDQTLTQNERAAQAVPTAARLAIDEAIHGPDAYRYTIFNLPKPSWLDQAKAAALRYRANLVGNIAYLQAQHTLVAAQKARSEAAFYARK